MKTRALLLLFALPLLAFDCGGSQAPTAGGSPFGLDCKLHVGGGAPAEDMWCIVTAHDYTNDPGSTSTTWVFELVAYRGMTDVGAGAGLFLAHRPALGTDYGWDGTSATTLVVSGGAERYGGSLQAGTYQQTHNSYSLGTGDGTGALSVRFTEIPPVNATGEQSIQVHGTLTATVPSMTAGSPATLSATF
jgi:hypothetical protein